MVNVCFGQGGVYLGELWTENGVFSKWSPSQTDTMLGPALMLWEDHGVPMTQSTGSTDAGGRREVITYRVSVEMRSPEFRNAVRAWGAGHDVTLIDLDPTRLPYWQTLLRLPMNPLKRFALLLDLRTAAEKEMGNWKLLLEELERAGIAARDGVRVRFAALEPKL